VSKEDIIYKERRFRPTGISNAHCSDLLAIKNENLVEIPTYFYMAERAI
jgi:hypothetical protein